MRTDGRPDRHEDANSCFSVLQMRLIKFISRKFLSGKHSNCKKHLNSSMRHVLFEFAFIGWIYGFLTVTSRVEDSSFLGCKAVLLGK